MTGHEELQALLNTITQARTAGEILKATVTVGGLGGVMVFCSSIVYKTIKEVIDLTRDKSKESYRLKSVNILIEDNLQDYKDAYEIPNKERVNILPLYTKQEYTELKKTTKWGSKDFKRTHKNVLLLLDLKMLKLITHLEEGLKARKFEVNRLSNKEIIRELDNIKYLKTLLEDEQFKLYIKPLLTKYESTITILINTLKESNKNLGSMTTKVYKKTFETLDNLLIDLQDAVNKLEETKLLDLEAIENSYIGFIEEEDKFVKEYVRLNRDTNVTPKEYKTFIDEDNNKN